MKHVAIYSLIVIAFLGCASPKKETDVVNAPTQSVVFSHSTTTPPGDPVEIVFSDKKKNNNTYSTTPAALSIPKSAPVNKTTP